jgi:hypothetical protein
MYEYGTLKFVEVILRRRKGKKENNGGDEPNQGTVYVHMKNVERSKMATGTQPQTF